MTFYRKLRHILMLACLRLALAQIPDTWNQTSGEEGVHVPGTMPRNPYEPLEMRSAFASPTAVTVSWNTFIQLDNPTVEYGENPSDLDKTAVSSLSFTYSTSRTYNNHVLITDLKPGTEYYYKVQHLNCNDCAYRSLGTFRTPRAAGDMTPYTAAFVADLGTMGPYGLSDTSSGVPLGPNETNCIQSMLENLESYEWAAHWGDFAYADFFLQMLDYGTFGIEASQVAPSAQQIADAYESITETFYDDLTPITSRRVYMAAPGNHEASCNGGKGEVAGVEFTKDICMEGQTNFTGYRNHWRMPDGNTQGALGNFWYSFDYGMAHFAVINTETDFDDAPAEGGRLDSGPFGRDGQQLAWLDKDLGDVDRSKTPWVIVAGHRPSYVSGVNGTVYSCIPCLEAFERQYKSSSVCALGLSFVSENSFDGQAWRRPGDEWTCARL